jgi:diguanylate cyclase (GGDEF)-like protein
MGPALNHTAKVYAYRATMQVINALVIDDEPDARSFLVASLQGGGLTVAEARSAEEALAQLEGFKPEIIVADVNLPAMSGFDLCRRVREMGHDDIPFIFCSALGGLPERIRGLRTGGDAYLVKPVGAEELMLHVNLHLERTRRARRAAQAPAAPLPDALTGRLEDVSLLETLQLIDMRGRGEPWIGIDTTDDHGEIFVSGRELVHASTRALTGHKALMRMLSWTTGAFRMEDRSWLADPTLEGRIDHILFDATAEVDEARALREKLPSDMLAVAPVPSLFTRVLPEGTLRVLRLVERHGTVDRVLDDTDTKDSDILRILLQLVEDGYVVAQGGPLRAAPPAPAPEPPAREDASPGAEGAAAPPASQVWEEMLRDLRREYLSGAGERLATLRDALAELEQDPADEPALQRALRCFHAFAGSGTTYGFPAVTARGSEGERRCLQLQRAGRAPDVEERAALGRLLSEIDTALAGEAAPERLPSVAGSEPRRVLVADPDPASVADLVQGLREEGFVVEEAATVEAARAALEDPPDALILDGRLEEGQRYDLLRRLHETPVGDRTMVLVIGTPGEFLDKVEAIQAGADAVLEKPLLRAPALRLLKRLLSRTAAQPGRVLAVDDDREQGAFYERVLGAAGYAVRVCPDPARLESDLAEFAPDLVIMDVVLPGVGGFDLARFIRQDERYTTLPVLFVTTQARTNARVEAVRAGGDDFLVKPLLAWLLLPAVAARIERGRLLRSLVDHDGLTRLPAHSAFLERAQSMLAQAIRDRDRRLAMVVFDIDGMRDINHRYGHVTGDRVLSACAEFLRRRLRPLDLVGRFGGDEFAAVLSDLDAPEAVRLVMRLRDEFGRVAIAAGPGEEPVHTKFSAGIAMLNPAGMDLRRWLWAADDALAKTRGTGSGRVRLATVEVVPEPAS